MYVHSEKYGFVKFREKVLGFSFPILPKHFKANPLPTEKNVHVIT